MKCQLALPTLAMTAKALLLLIATSNTALALNSESEADFRAYCKYISEKNSAKSTALKSPDAIVRVANGDINNNFQKLAIAALSKDLSDLNKARYVDKLITEECNFYQISQEAKLQVEYAILAAKNEALQYKLQEIKFAKRELNDVLHRVKNRLDQHNDTLRSYYEVDMSIKKLEDTERQIYVDLVSRQIPKMKRIPLKKLLMDLQQAQHNRQQTLNSLHKNDNWSLQLQAGAQQNWPNNQSQNVQPYFALLMRYNLGAISSSKQVNRSLNSYMDWQNQKLLGTQKKLFNLLKSIKELKTVEQSRLSYLNENFQKYQALSKKINDLNSNEAQNFKREIDVERILMGIEIKYIQHTIRQLEKLIE